MSLNGDRVMRAITLDGGFRVITCRTTQLVRDAVALQKLSGADARTFGELLTGAVLVRETMAPGHRLQAILSNPGTGTMIADSHPPQASEDGVVEAALTRGLVNRQGADSTRRILAEGAILKVIRSLPRGRLHQSIVEARPAGMAEALMSYMQESEQVFATLGVATVVDGDRVIASGGFIVQLLPELSDAPLAIMTERLAHDFRVLDALLVEHDVTPTPTTTAVASGDTDAASSPDPRGLAGWLMRELLYGFPYETLADEGLRCACDCSAARVLGAIATLGRDELASIVAQSEVLDLTCEYCTRTWKVGPEQIRSLLEPT